MHKTTKKGVGNLIVIPRFNFVNKSTYANFNLRRISTKETSLKDPLIISF